MAPPPFVQEMSMSQSKDGLNFREFLLCLSIGSVLQLFPLMKAYDSHELPPCVHSSSFVEGTIHSPNPFPQRHCIRWPATFRQELCLYD